MASEFSVGSFAVTPEELREVLHTQPFQPFRLVMTDGQGYEIRHPDLMMVGRRSAMVGLTGRPGRTYYERAVQVDLLHVIRLEPLETATSGPKREAS